MLIDPFLRWRLQKMLQIVCKEDSCFSNDAFFVSSNFGEESIAVDEKKQSDFPFFANKLHFPLYNA